MISGVPARWTSGVAAMLVLVSCASPVPRPPASELEAKWQARRVAIEQIHQWELHGRLAITMDSRGGQATILWSRDGVRELLALNGPIGSGSVRISRDIHGARLRDSAKREIQAETIEQLLQIYSGWRLPIANLDWWVRGLPVPGTMFHHELDHSGRIEVLVQDHWHVHYDRYKTINGLDLPHRVTLAREAINDEPAIAARLVIDRWVSVK